MHGCAFGWVFARGRISKFSCVATQLERREKREFAVVLDEEKRGERKDFAFYMVRF